MTQPAYLYASPLRPCDIGYVSRTAGVEIDWDHTEIGEWHREAVMAFVAPLPDAIVDGFQLEAVDYLDGILRPEDMPEARSSGPL